ncbi:MAG TPA: ABC transporter substrate-binding protein [Streptosporangiaceae bacterium]|jgi:NitT/TauT family transport system substrate-binding protein|nr:ABC transporter substrate-binding protein [Streptosporangiaceae bacterium]
MFRRSVIKIASAASVAALAAGLAACGSSSSSSSSAATGSNAASSVSGLPTVSLMVGGIDKQIYLPYQLAQQLGFYKKYGVNVQLSTEQNGGVGAETAMVSGQVDMAGAWYVHTIDFQQKGKAVVDVVQLSGAPGEREMCAKNSAVTSPADWKGKNLGVTDIGSGTDNLTRYLAARYHLTSTQFNRVAVGAGPTFVASLQHGRIACGMTTQPTVNAIEKQGIGTSVINLASTGGAQQWLGGAYPAAGVLARADWVASHRATVQKVVDALVATMHWISTHSAADIANAMPAGFVSNGLTTKADYIAALAQDKGQFLPDGMMPANGPATVLAIDKLAGNVTGPVNLASTYTNQYAIAANKLEGFTK